MPVYYRCKSCGEEHPSPIGFGDRQSFETNSMSGNKFQCPTSGKSASYDKGDMVWRDRPNPSKGSRP